MKRVLSLILGLALCPGLFACGTTPEPTETTARPLTPEELVAKDVCADYIAKHPDRADAFYIYGEEELFVTIENGEPTGTYDFQEDAFDALVGENADSYLQTQVTDLLFMVQDNTKPISLYYDDRFEIVDRAVEIVDAGTPTSYQVGAEADTLDEAVIVLEDDTLIATGIGTAQIDLDGAIFQVEVTPAPISIFMITGHSMGEGVEGNAADSVMNPEGQVYSSYGTKCLDETTEGVGIGYTAVNPANEIDALTATGNGAPGEGSALAWQWNRLTEEKVWILNTAVGGSCLKEWLPECGFYQDALLQFQRAQAILTNEISAGHYTLKDMGIIYHNGANFYSKKVDYTFEELQSWYDAMWNGFKTDLSTDMNGDGTPETVSFLGLVPFWNISSGFSYIEDEPAGMYMSASKDYPDIFTASVIGQDWLTDSGVKEKFPEITYPSYLERPTAIAEVFAADNTHYQQVGYNAVGIDIANNLYTKLRGEATTPEVKLYNGRNMKEFEGPVELELGEPIELTVVTNPITSGDLDFAVSGSIEMLYPLQIAATGNGSGTLTISYNGTVLKELEFVCNDA